MRTRPAKSSGKFLTLASILTACLPIARAQQPSPSSTDPGTIKVETRVVLVDTVVTDKKGNYIRDLASNDFKVWEDGKEQPVTSFSREDSAADPSHSGKHYLVLFFDNSTMEFADQAKARMLRRSSSTRIPVPIASSRWLSLAAWSESHRTLLRTPIV